MRLNKKVAKLKKAPGPTGEDKHWPMMKELLENGLELRKPFEQRWIICLAFLAGRQYTFFNSSAYMLQQINPVRGRLRNVDNKLLPKWRRQISDLIKNDPIMSVIPETNDDEDIKAAKTGDKVIKSFWRSGKMKKKIRELAGWQFATGNAFLDDRWNPKLGPVQIDKESGILEYMGDVDVGVWSPFEIVVPFTGLGNTDLDRFPWMMKIKWRGLDWYKNNFKRGGEVPSESPTIAFTDINLLLGTPGSSTAHIEEEGALCVNLFIQPNEEFKKGIFLTGANGVILNAQDYPFDHYHMSQFKDIDSPGIFWGKSTTEEAIPLQKVWNRTMSSIDEYNRMIARGKGLVPRGSKLDTIPDSTHGEWIEYTPVLGHKPEIMDLKNLPQTYEQVLAHTNVSIEDLYSQHEVSRGTNKSDIRSGEMVSILREQDAHGNIPSHAVFEESLEGLMQRVLRRIQAGYKEERMLKIVGHEGEFDIFAFKGTDLRNNTDVSVKRQSSMPESRAAREALIMEKFERGLYGDPSDPEVRRHVMNMLDDAVVKDIYSDVRLDEHYSRWENRILRSGKQVYLINSYDDHGIHVREHNHFRKSMEFQKIKLEKPQMFLLIDQMIEKHVMVHQKYIEAARKKMMREQMMMGGGGKQ
jgi:hypothetical protein